MIVCFFGVSSRCLHAQELRFFSFSNNEWESEEKEAFCKGLCRLIGKTFPRVFLFTAFFMMKQGAFLGNKICCGYRIL